MKAKFLIICAIVSSVLLINTTTLSANWYAGSQRSEANGIWANIDTPDNLNMVTIDLSGEFNWVSTYYSNQNGISWIQTGWKFFYWYSSPKQYVEWCINCTDQSGTYEMKDAFANQNWSTQIDYLVEHITQKQWCAYTNGVIRYCVINLHSSPVTVMAKSEVSGSVMNPLSTYYSQVKYKDPNDGSWSFFDDQRIWHSDFPYDTEKYSNSNFLAYRTNTKEIFLPLVLK